MRLFICHPSRRFRFLVVFFLTKSNNRVILRMLICGHKLIHRKWGSCWKSYFHPSQPSLWPQVPVPSLPLALAIMQWAVFSIWPGCQSRRGAISPQRLGGTSSYTVIGTWAGWEPAVTEPWSVLWLPWSSWTFLVVKDAFLLKRCVPCPLVMNVLGISFLKF